MLAVIFTVDAERASGISAAIANEEVAEAAAAHARRADPVREHRPAARARWACARRARLIESYGVRGFKFHPSAQGFYPNDRMAYRSTR